MPAERVSMRQAREIIRLKFSTSLPTREIARRLGLAPSTVRETLSCLDSAGLSWPLPEGIGDAELQAALYANRRSKRGHRPPTPTPSWTVSSITFIASNSPAKACVGHKQSNQGRLDPTPQPVTTIHRPARLATRAASFRYGGRHHSGIPGGIIPLYPGGFVGIGKVRWTRTPCSASKGLLGGTN